LISFLGDFDLAEEAAPEAFAIAVERWPRDGAPAKPGAWLVTTPAISPGAQAETPRPGGNRD
jgi:predicted RNA polymerase sigma factor